MPEATDIVKVERLLQELYAKKQWQSSKSSWLRFIPSLETSFIERPRSLQKTDCLHQDSLASSEDLRYKVHACSPNRSLANVRRGARSTTATGPEGAGTGRERPAPPPAIITNSSRCTISPGRQLSASWSGCLGRPSMALWQSGRVGGSLPEGRDDFEI